MKTVTKIVVAALIFVSSATARVSQADILKIMKASVANGELDADHGSDALWIVEPGNVKSWKANATPATINNKTWYYGTITFKVGFLTRTLQTRRACITPTGVLIGWEIPRKKADGTTSYVSARVAREVIDRRKAYDRALAEAEYEKERLEHARQRAVAIAKRDAERKAAIAKQNAEQAKKAAQLKAKLDGIRLLAKHAKPLSASDQRVVDLALEGIYKKRDMILRYQPGTLKREKIVGDIERWTIVTVKRGTDDMIIVEFDAEIGLLIHVTKVKVSKADGSPIFDNLLQLLGEDIKALENKLMKELNGQ